MSQNRRMRLLIFFAGGCIIFMQSIYANKQSSLRLSCENLNTAELNAHINMLNLGALYCSRASDCADIHYELAMAYLARPSINAQTHRIVQIHLEIASHAKKYRRYAMLLSKLLSGWSQELERSNVCNSKLKKLEQDFDRAKAIDLEAVKD